MNSDRWDERLAVPLWWWPAGVGLALLGGAALHGGVAGWRAVVPYVALVAVMLVVLATVSRGRVRVDGGVLQVPGARLPLGAIGAVRPLDVEQTRRLRGPAADRYAYVATRAWLPRAVQVQIEDADDDTPYWLVGTRRPEQLARTIEAARVRAG